MYCGWRAKIAIIFPANGTHPEYEFHKYAPEGVSIMSQRVLFERVDPKGLEEMGNRAVDAAKFVATGNPDLIVFCCTSGSLIKGHGYDKEIIARIEDSCGIKATTTTTAVITALETLGAKRLAVSTPYSNIVNEIEKKFLEDSGFEVLTIKGLGNEDPNAMPMTTFDKMYRLTRDVLTPGADTIFVSCTGLGVAHGINMMENDFGLPVVTSNQATLWGALRMLSIGENVGLGKLFTL